MAKKMNKRPETLTTKVLMKNLKEFNAQLGTDQAPESIPKEYRD